MNHLLVMTAENKASIEAGLQRIRECAARGLDELDKAVHRLDVLQGRIDLLEDLLSSAHAIAKRNGEDTHWERFSARLTACGIGAITAKTFRLLPSDREANSDGRVNP